MASITCLSLHCWNPIKPIATALWPSVLWVLPSALFTSQLYYWGSRRVGKRQWTTSTEHYRPMRVTQPEIKLCPPYCQLQIWQRRFPIQRRRCNSSYPRNQPRNDGMLRKINVSKGVLNSDPPWKYSMFWEHLKYREIQKSAWSGLHVHQTFSRPRFSL